MLGHELLDTLHSLTAHRAVAAVMRHTARHPIANPAEPTLAEITEEGARTAEAFGARITGFDHVRIFHSPVKRCAQTAACIARGSAAAGLPVELAGSREELGVAYILDLVEAGRLSTLHGEHFIRLWFSGQMQESVILPAPGLAEYQVNHVAARLRDPLPAGRRLDLHVSHDWNIIVLRELLLGVRHEDVGWLSFLDGVVFTPEAEQVRAFYRDRQRVLDRPARQA